jgi:hypothetical protein
MSYELSSVTTRYYVPHTDKFFSVHAHCYCSSYSATYVSSKSLCGVIMCYKDITIKHSYYILYSTSSRQQYLFFVFYFNLGDISILYFAKLRFFFKVYIIQGQGFCLLTELDSLYYP